MRAKPKKKFVLVVEDENDLRELIKRKLERGNYSSICCSTIRDALNKLSNQVFDLLILDIRLQDGTGEDIIGYLKKRTYANLNQHTPILVISGHMDAKLLDNIKHDIANVLVKPFTQEALMNKVNEIIPA